MQPPRPSAFTRTTPRDHALGSQTRVPGSMVQLQEIRLYANGELLNIEALGGTASNENGSNPNAHPVDNLFDADVSECARTAPPSAPHPHSLA